MKCTQCNAPVTLEEEFCPYCGALNIAARQHIEDMKRFSSDYSYTKSEVMDNVTKQSKKHTRILLLGSLIGLNIIGLALHTQYYDIQYEINQWKNKARASSYEASMAKLEENGKYLEMYELYSRKDLYGCSDSLESYTTVTEMAYDYNQLKENIYYLYSDNCEDISSKSQALENAASGIYEFYNNYSYRDQEYFKERFSDKHLKAMEDMKDQMNAILSSYCSFDSKDLAKLSDLDKTELLLLLEKRMNIYE